MYVRIVKWMGLFITLICLLSTYRIVNLVVSDIKFEKRLEHGVQRLDKVMSNNNARERKLYQQETELAILRLEIGMMRIIYVHQSNSRLELLEKEAEAFARSMREQEQEIEALKEEADSLNIKIQGYKEKIKENRLFMFVFCIALLFIFPFGFASLMIALPNAFKIGEQGETGLVDFYRYNLANMTSFGNVNIYPITLGAKITILLEHILGVFYIIILIAVILDLGAI